MKKHEFERQDLVEPSEGPRLLRSSGFLAVAIASQGRVGLLGTSGP